MSGKQEITKVIERPLKSSISGLVTIVGGTICFFSISKEIGVSIGIVGFVLLAMSFRIYMKSKMKFAKFDDKERLYEMLESEKRISYEKMSVILLEEYIIDYRAGLSIIKLSDIANLSSYKDVAKIATAIWIVLKLRNGKEHRLVAMGANAGRDYVVQFMHELESKGIECETPSINEQQKS